MKRIDHSTAQNNLFTEGNPTTGVPATTVTAEWLNLVQEEICNIIEDSDGGNTTLDGASNVQLKEAVAAMIAAAGGGGGGGGGAFAKTDFGYAGSDSSTTSTSNQTTNVSKVYTPVDGTSRRLVSVYLDWLVQDTAGSEATAYAVLEKSIDGGAYTTIKEFTNQLQQTANGQLLINTNKTALGSDAVTTSTTIQPTGLQSNYTPIDGNNKRLIQAFVKHRSQDTNGGAASTTAVLEYYTGSVWQELASMANQGNHPATSSIQELTHFIEIEDETNDSSPQYRISHYVNNSGDASTVRADSFINVQEFSKLVINNNRKTCFAEFIDDSDATTNVTYRISHRVANGDTSTIKTGSGILIKEL